MDDDNIDDILNDHVLNDLDDALYVDEFDNDHDDADMDNFMTDDVNDFDNVWDARNLSLSYGR